MSNCTEISVKSDMLMSKITIQIKLYHAFSEIARKNQNLYISLFQGKKLPAKKIFLYIRPFGVEFYQFCQDL